MSEEEETRDRCGRVGFFHRRIGMASCFVGPTDRMASQASQMVSTLEWFNPSNNGFGRI